MNNKEVILRIVRTCRKAIHLSEIFFSEFANGGMNVFDDFHGDLEDALYILCDEDTFELKDSIVDKLIRNPNLSDEEITETICKLIPSCV